jgi:hypothetical protein
LIDWIDVEVMFKTSGAEATLSITDASGHALLDELAMSCDLDDVAWA